MLVAIFSLLMTYVWREVNTPGEEFDNKPRLKEMAN